MIHFWEIPKAPLFDSLGAQDAFSATDFFEYIPGGLLVLLSELDNVIRGMIAQAV